MTNLTASDLYSISQGHHNSGDQECFWCGSRCLRRVLHSERHPDIGQKHRIPCKRPSNAYVCQGCWLYQRKSVTVVYPDNSLRDRQQPSKQSWWITPENAYGVLFGPAFYPILLSPPLRFTMALINDGCPNYLQCMLANDHLQVKPTTELHFTLNNIPMSYTVYELEEALQNGVEGRTGGTRELVNLFGPYELPQNKVADPKKRGRPINKDTDMHPAKKVISSFLSGSAVKMATA